jgi:hypothetical protein
VKAFFSEDVEKHDVLREKREKREKTIVFLNVPGMRKCFKLIT